MPVPTAPIISVRPAVTATTLQFWWSPPAQTNGTITNYLLECAPASISQSISAAARTATVTSLTIATNYTFTLKAVNATGASVAATFHTVQTSAVPQPVSTLTVSESVTGGILSLVFSWTNPADYAYFYAYGLRQATGTKDFIYTGTSDYTTLSYTATNLNPYQTYTFHIQRGNDAAYSSATSLTTTTRLLDPTTIPGLWLWLDAVDVSGNGATVPDGTPVATWVDKSGTANSATPPPLARATLRTDSIGRYLQFTGSQFYVTRYTQPATTYITMFIVDSFTPGLVSQLDDGHRSTLIDPSGNSGQFPTLAYKGPGTIHYNFNNLDADFSYNFQQANVWCISNYTMQNIYQNKQLVYSQGYTGPYTVSPNINIGGGATGNYLNYTGKIREVLIYFGPMAESSRAAISDYLCAKWAAPPAETILPVQRGLTQWLDANDINTMYQDISGSKNIYGHNYITNLWKDKSGNGNNMAYVYNAGYTVAPALYRADIMNGMPALDFSQGNGTLFASNPIPLKTEITIFMIVLMTPIAGLSAVSHIWSHGQDNTDANLCVSNGTHQIYFGMNNDVFSTQTPFVVNRPGLYIATMSNEQITFFESFDLSGNTVKKVIQPQPPFWANSGKYNQANPISLGGWYFSQASANQSGCAFSEIIYYQRVLSSEEIAATASYLTKKWGIYVPPVPTVPTDLPNLQLWLDAADTVTTQHNGSTLTAWYDKSGRQNNPTGVGAPGYSATTDISGIPFSIPGITFNGTSQWFTLPNGALPSGNSPYSYYIVATSTDVSGYGYGVISGGTNADQFSMNVVGTNTMSLTSDVRNFTTTDGINWQPIMKFSMFSATGGLDTIAWNGSYWLGYGFISYRNIAVFLKSSDGINWTDTQTPSAFLALFAVNHIVWNGSVWIASTTPANSSSPVAVGIYSSNGTTWTNGTGLPTGVDGATLSQGMATNGSLTLLAGVAGAGSAAYYSTNGTTWTVNASMTSVMPNPIDITCNGSTWIAGGYFGNSANPQGLAYSTDGYTWQASANGNTVIGYDVKCVAASPNMFVAGGDQFGTAYGLAYSSDGITWYGTNAAYGIGYPIVSLKWNGKVFLGSCLTGPIWNMYSPDGVTWFASKYNPVGNGPNFGTMLSGSYSVAKLYPSLQTTLGALPTRPVVAIAGSSPTGEVIYTYDGLTWYPSAVNSIISNVYSLGYNGKMWIVAAAFQACAYSYDGLNWLPIMDPYFTTTVPLAFAWTGSIWVCGLQSTLGSLWSADGLTWNIANGSGIMTGSQLGIATSGSLTVMCGTNDNGSAPTAWTSTDGKNWIANSSLTSIIDFRPVCVAYNGTIWVAGGCGSNSLAWSSDGLTWTAANSSPFVGSDTCATVAWNGSIWVAGGSTIYSASANSILTSTDGQTWDPSTSGSALFTYCFSLAWNGTYWNAGGLGSTRLAYSSDGINWSAVTSSPFSTSAQGNYMVSAYALPITTTPSPPTLPPLAPPSGSTPSVLAVKSYPISRKMNLLESFYSAKDNTVTEYANGQNVITRPAKVKYVMGGNIGTGGYYFPSGIVYSYDGVTVNRVLNCPLNIAYAVAFNGSLWVAVGTDNAGGAVCSATSIDGVTWTRGPNNVGENPLFTSDALCVAWNGSYWLAGGHDYSKPNFMKSPDGFIWTGCTNNPFPGGAPFAIAWNGSYWVAVGSDSGGAVTVAVSSDGMTWTASTTSPFIPGGTNRSGVVWNGSIWVAVGEGLNTVAVSSIAVSSDGMTWTPVWSPLSFGNAVAWNGSYFVAVGSGNANTIGIARSYDGLLWTPIPLPGLTSINCKSVCWDGLQWVVIGSNSSYGILVTSTDGINWTVNNLSTSAVNGLSIAARVPLRLQDVSGNLLGLSLGQKMKGAIHEVLVYAAEHQPQQRQFVENYLQNKWFPNNYSPTAITATKGLWLDANPANLVYSSGTSIETWKDKSGSGVDFTQATVINQPTYEFDEVTNRYGVRFSSQAVTSNLSSSVGPFGFTQTWSIVVVARFTQISSNNNVFSIMGSSQNLLRISSGSTLDMYVGGQESTVTIQNSTNAFVYTSSVDPSGNWINYFNGVPVKTGTSASAMTPNFIPYLGWNVNSGFSNMLQNCEGFTGYIYEVFAFQTALSSTDQQALEGYLAWKWGLQGYLGTTYSSVPPTFYVAPTPITGLTAPQKSGTGILLSWSGGVGATSYTYTVNGTAATAATHGATFASFVGLTASTSYTIVVRAINAIGSVTASITTSTPASSGFTPASVSNLLGWYDATDPLGTGTAPAIGTVISTWYDKSGLGNNATSSLTIGFGPVIDEPFHGGDGNTGGGGQPGFLAWNGSYWLCLGYNGNNSICIAKSYDGLAWTPSTNNPFNGNIGKGAAWNGSMWVAVGANGNNPVTVGMATSYDGMNWTEVTKPLTKGYCTTVAWNGSYFLAACNNSSNTYIIKSADGFNWSAANTNNLFASVPNGFAWNGSYWLALGGDQGNQGTYTILQSTDGENWTDTASLGGNSPFTGSQGAAQSATWNGSYWVAIGGNNGGTLIAKSSDGITWTLVQNADLPFGGNGSGGRAVAWNGSYWIAASNGTTGNSDMATSSDGITWVGHKIFASSSSASGANWVGWNGSYWVLVGAGNYNYCMYTTQAQQLLNDGKNYINMMNTPYTLPTNSLNSILYDYTRVSPGPVSGFTIMYIENFQGHRGWGPNSSSGYGVFPFLLGAFGQFSGGETCIVLQYSLTDNQQNSRSINNCARKNMFNDNNGFSDSNQTYPNSMYQPYSICVNKPVIHCFTWQGGSTAGQGGNSAAYINGSQIASRTATENTNDATTHTGTQFTGNITENYYPPLVSGYTTPTIGSYNLYPNSPYAGQYFTHMREFLVYSGAVTQTQRQNLEGYLAWKWDAQGSLPKSHPYYYISP